MAVKKYLSLDRLEEYDALLKQKIDSGDASTLSSAKSYTDTAVSNITNGTTVVKNAEHANSADSATTATKLGSASVGSASQPIYLNAGTATKVSSVGVAYGGTGATTAAGARTNLDVYSTTEVDNKLSGKSDSTHNHDGKYDAKGAADGALASAKTYADNAAKAVKDDLLNGAGDAYDTLKELGDLIVDNADAIDALETVASGKADKTHTHAIGDVTGLQSALDGKAASSHGTHVTYSTTAPVMDGSASVGTASTVARSDHKHPTDTSRASKTEFDAHAGDTTKHITATERTNWNAAKTHADSAHAPSNAEKNQNAFSNVKVGTTTVAADTATDTLTIVAGTNVQITADANGDSITISATDTKVTVDSALSASSTNPVQNKVVNNAISTLTSTVSANTQSISSHTTAIGNLQAAVAEFEEITSAEISALFAQ